MRWREARAPRDPGSHFAASRRHTGPPRQKPCRAPQGAPGETPPRRGWVLPLSSARAPLLLCALFRGLWVKLCEGKKTVEPFFFFLILKIKELEQKRRRLKSHLAKEANSDSR